MLRAALIACVSATAMTAHAAEGPHLSITIYNSDLALVEDARNLDIAAGRSKLEFKDVSAKIQAQTATLAAPGVAIVEQNFDFDLLSPGKLMEKAVGHEVKIVRTNPGDGKEVTETATVLAVNDGVVLRIGDRIEVLRDDGVPTRVIFDKVPENLRARPTLSVTVDSDHAGQRVGVLSYLTRGLSWKADYVALFDEKAGKLDLQGWITLTNESGVRYPDAEAQLVAGDVALSGGGDDDEASEFIRRQQNQRAGVSSAGAEAGPATSVADYYLYPLPQRTTIEENQTKQVSFIDARGVAARKVYRYRADSFNTNTKPESADVALQFANSSSGGLGAALPAGVLRVYMRDAASEAKFVGENEIGHTPRGSSLDVKTGDAFDVTVQPTLVSTERKSDRRWRYSMSYLLKNARAEPVTVVLEQGGLWLNGKVVEESLKSRRLDASRLAWDVPVPAGGETTLTFSVDNSW